MTPLNFGSPVVRTSVALGVVLALIVLLAGIAKRVTRSGSPLAAALGASRSPAGILEVLGRYPLARGHTLVLIKIERRILLLGQTAGRIRAGGGGLVTLAVLDDPEDVASILLKVQEAEGNTTADRFRELLQKFDQSHGDGVEEVRQADRGRTESSLDMLRRLQEQGDHVDQAGEVDVPVGGLRLVDFEAQVTRANARAAAASGGRARR